MDATHSTVSESLEYIDHRGALALIPIWFLALQIDLWFEMRTLARPAKTLSVVQIIEQSGLDYSQILSRLVGLAARENDLMACAIIAMWAPSEQLRQDARKELHLAYQLNPHFYGLARVLDNGRALANHATIALGRQRIEGEIVALRKISKPDDIVCRVTIRTADGSRFRGNLPSRMVMDLGINQLIGQHVTLVATVIEAISTEAKFQRARAA